MKNLRRVLSCLLAVTMLLALGVTASAAEFTDVPAGSDYAEAVQWASDNGYIYGYGDGRFGVNDNVTRAQLATIFHRAAGTPAASGTSRFSDAEAGAYYINALSWAETAGLIAGYPDGRFGVGDSVTRQQVATILWRWAGSPAASAENYLDENAISAYAQTAVDWSRSNGIIAARSDGRFAPTDNATRGEIVSALYNYMGKTSTPPASAGNGKILVAYFSMPETTNPNNMTTEEANSTVVIDGEVLGNTQYMAQVIQRTTNADIYRIEPQTPYPTDHTTLVDQARDEQNQDTRPAIKDSISNFDSYDTIFIGYPIWWSDLPQILYTFFDTYDFSGKTVIPFSTHGGSSFAGTPATIQRLEPNAKMLDGLTISRNNIQDAEQEIITWVNGLDY